MSEHSDAVQYYDESWGITRDLVQMLRETSRPGRSMIEVKKDDDDGITWDWRAMQAEKA